MSSGSVNMGVGDRLPRLRLDWEGLGRGLDARFLLLGETAVRCTG
jgi:hypothetical protein